MNTKQLFIALTLLALISCDPTPPIWADQWYQEFYDEWTFTGGKTTTTGFYAYDWTNNKQSVYREDCSVDILTESVLEGEKIACSQFVNQGNRYVYAESKNFCCFCCDAAHGCGLLKPDWITKAGEEFQGTKVINGEVYNVFRNFDGPSPVYTLYNAKTDIQSFISRPGSKEMMTFDQQSYTTNIKPSILEFPAACQVENVPICQGKCSVFRDSKEEKQ